MFDDRESIALGTGGRPLDGERSELSLVDTELGVMVLDPAADAASLEPWRPVFVGPFAAGRRKEEDEADSEEEEAEDSEEAEEEDEGLDDDFDDEDFDDEEDDDFDDDDDEDEDWDDEES